MALECRTMIRAGLLLAVILAAPVWADPFDDVRLKRHAMLTGGAGIDYSLPQIHARLANIESSARGYWSSLQKDPGRAALWPDLASATISAQITSAWSRLKSMALAWATPGQNLYGDAALLADVRSAAAWLEENRYNARVPKEYDNWWDWEIGTPLQLGDLLVLLHDQLTPEETAKYAAAIDRFDSDPRVMIVSTVSTGANRVWKCMGMLLRAIAVKDAAKLQLASDSLGAVFPYVTSGDGFYQDGSFIQHGRHPYTGGFVLRKVFYTVPSRLIRHRLRSRLYDDRVELFVGGTRVLSLVRGRPGRDGKHAHVVDYHHVIHALQSKTMALLNLVYRDQLWPREAYRHMFDCLCDRQSDRSACKLMVELLSLAHDRACEAQLAAILTEDLAARRLPDLKELRARFAPDLASLPQVCVQLTPLSLYEALNDACMGEAA